MTRLIRSLSTTPGPSSFTYPEVGATRTGPLPDGYHHLRHRTRIGRGEEAFRAAGAAVTTWGMHRGAGALVTADTPRAEPGTAVEIALRVGPLRIGAPCEVVWTACGSERVGFAYGTTAGHPERGEESFVVELRPDGSVWFTVTAFSRPARWYTRVAGPLVPAAQHWYARRLGRTLRRIAAA
ncbi:DUF1990 family protein [Streptomyces sp. SP18CS02]|uniref:DUF1990 family protein n=1 Tax=Streptomyces sp. SP18CS02 TaxID=3002531 RepID=UPI002E765A60|nr:DUF1990 domain-containing protein [Streptomyces sp. SP18CS02]MEE1754503.1 DUF1990 domain-containing protein [Streptomyces sp. SP18CS02]